MKSLISSSIWKVVALLYISLFTITESEDLELKLVQLVWRHGDRAPVDTYPNDPWKNNWKVELGQLTELGQQQQHKVGQYLRKRYGHLVNYTYNNEAIYIRSTDVDRTLMSAYANLAGFFPSKGDHVWKNNIHWRPILVHIMPIEDDHVLSVKSKCPKYGKLLKEVLKSEEAEKINAQYRDLFKFLSEKCGKTFNNFIEASDLYDILLAQKAHGFKWPEWVTKKIFANLETFRDILSVWLGKTHEIQRIVGGGGMLVGEMTKNMETAIENPNNKYKIYIYSAHDATISTFLSALGVFNGKAPPYRSVVMVELWKGNGNFVKFLYRNDTTHDPYELKLKDCPILCPFEKFKELTASVVPSDVRAECGLTTAATSLLTTKEIDFYGKKGLV